MIEFKKFKYEPVIVYKPDGTELCRCTNATEFDHIRVQIGFKKIPGYYYTFKDETGIIDTDGRCNNWPDGMYDLFEIMASEILGFAKDENKRMSDYEKYLKKIEPYIVK